MTCVNRATRSSIGFGMMWERTWNPLQQMADDAPGKSETYSGEGDKAELRHCARRGFQCCSASSTTFCPDRASTRHANTRRHCFRRSQRRRVQSSGRHAAAGAVILVRPRRRGRD